MSTPLGIRQLQSFKKWHASKETDPLRSPRSPEETEGASALLWCSSMVAGTHVRKEIVVQHQLTANKMMNEPSHANKAPSFPVSSKEFSTVIQGIKTDFVLCSYDDYIFVLATQLGKMGTLLQARKEEGYGSEITFSVSVLLGKHDEPMLQASARQLIERISDMGSLRPLLLSLGLKDHSRETLKEIVETVCENKVW